MDVLTLDRVPAAPQHRDFVRVDLTDYGQTVEALSAIDDRYQGIDALVRLAAIPAPGLTTNAATFSNNMTSTYNVCSAARQLGSSACRNDQHRVGIQRDGARVAVRHPRRPTFRWTRNIPVGPSPPIPS